MPKEIIFCTTNEEKLLQARVTFEPAIKILSQKIDLFEEQTLDQEKVALSKARQAFELLKKPVIVDDTGIYFKKYNNFPGVLTRFIYEALAIEGILKLVEQDDVCYFRSIVVYKDAEREIISNGYLNGKIEKNNRGEIKKFVPYRSIFKCDDLNGKLLQKCTEEEMNQFSHRGKAFNELKKQLLNE